MDTPTLLAHLQTHGTPLTLPRGAAPRWDDADLHRTAHTADPAGYALLGLATGVTPWQRARVLLQILAASHAGLDTGTRTVQARVARILTLALPPPHVITVLLTLRRLRANHKHTTRAALRFILEHPAADTLIAARRPALRDCFEHALGTTAARGCARRIADGDTTSDYLRRRLLRFLTDPAAAPARVQALYRPAEPGPPVPTHPALPLDPPTGPPAHPPFTGTITLVLAAPPPLPPPAAELPPALARICPRLHLTTEPATGPAADLIAVISTGPPHHAPAVTCRPPATGPPRPLRRPGDADTLLPWILAHCTTGRTWLHTALHTRLDHLEHHADHLTAGHAARPAPEPAPQKGCRAHHRTV